MEEIRPPSDGRSFFALAKGAKGGTLRVMGEPNATNAANAEPGPLKASRNSVLAHLIAIAEEPGTKPKERIGALAEIARIKGMVTKKVETSMTIKGSVMLVPFCQSAEEWSGLTMAHDKRLRDEVKRAPLPTPDQ
jgi:hypothetical protein